MEPFLSSSLDEKSSLQPPNLQDGREAQRDAQHRGFQRQLGELRERIEELEGRLAAAQQVQSHVQHQDTVSQEQILARLSTIEHRLEHGPFAVIRWGWKLLWPVRRIACGLRQGVRRAQSAIESFQRWWTRMRCPKASIIVLLHDNLELNALCIESIYRYTDWLNFEVILVDNASTDGSREFAVAIAAQHDNVKLVLNDHNESFARANNLGARAASGKYLVFLNNDTIVTRGWLAGLVRYLEAEPDIGLVGPVSNAVGNEAKVAVTYTSTNGIESFAEQYCRAHAGLSFEIPMLALFCGAMKRDIFLRMGGLDEQFAVGGFEDDDLAERLHCAGLRTVCAADVFVHHFQNASFGKIAVAEMRQIFEANRARFEAKWGPWKPPHQGALPSSECIRCGPSERWSKGKGLGNGKLGNAVSRAQ